MMVKTALAVCALASLAGAAHAAADVEAGKAKAAQCAACHGQDGNSAIAMPGAAGQPATYSAKLAGQNASYIAKQLADYKSGARKNDIMSGMAAPLSDQDIQNLAAYFAAQKLQVGAANKVSLALGQKIFRGGDASRSLAACMSCHGPDGAGNPPAKFPRVGGQQADYTLAQLQRFKDGTRANDPNAMMRDTAGRMTADEIKAVSEYMAGLY